MSGKTRDCIFCKIANKEIEAALEHEDAAVVAFNDNKPRAPVHVLIIPKKHIERASDVTIANAAIVGKMTLAAKKIAKKRKILNSGYRLVINCGKEAGQAVKHLHMHLLGGRLFGWPPG